MGLNIYYYKKRGKSLKIYKIKLGFSSNHSCTGTVHHFFLVKEYVQEEDRSEITPFGEIVEIGLEYLWELDPLHYFKDKNDEEYLELMNKLREGIYNIFHISVTLNGEGYGDFLDESDSEFLESWDDCWVLVTVANKHVKKRINELKKKYRTMELLGSEEGYYLS